MIDVIIRFMADGLVVPIVLLATYVLLFRLKTTHWFASYLRILVAGLSAYALAKLIGYFFQPEIERPFQKLGLNAGATYLDNPGFPSDHVLFCIAIFWAVWTQSKARWAAIVILFLAVLVGLGRVLALVHTPLDVLGGVVIASIGALWYLTERFANDTETASRKKHKKEVE
jgi:membrane-associated phospholipid phosphatase